MLLLSLSPISSRFDAYCDPYASDTSSQERSGSITPIIDKEARLANFKF
ncbi:hypothetical protein WUBG_16004 [Wuchereria bancrofti]|uniref:Uncharacterized protein n=1 Tax=Wuchereria bancrofti TaxID=6293 RepID=J9DTV9_WUCBA|nr:hypothetical protein WUBG_16004 [Wuchereria bancrofti]